MELIEPLLTHGTLWSVVFVATSGLVFGCAAQRAAVRPPEPFAAPTRPVIIAHRGGSLEAPENTLAAVAHGVASGAEWQEIDVTLTSDGEVVVIHDDTLDRTTDGAGRVDALTLEAVRAVSAGRPRWSETGRATLAAFGVTPPVFDERYDGEKVPTLREVLSIPNARLMIELKKTTRREAFIDKVLADIRAAGAQDRVALGSFERPLLELVHAREPELALIGIVEEERAIADMLDLPVSVLAVRIDLIEDALAKAPTGVAVWSWTAYTLEMAEAIAARGAHGVITDAPKAVAAAWLK